MDSIAPKERRPTHGVGGRSKVGALTLERMSFKVADKESEAFFTRKFGKSDKSEKSEFLEVPLTLIFAGLAAIATLAGVIASLLPSFLELEKRK